MKTTTIIGLLLLSPIVWAIFGALFWWVCGWNKRDENLAGIMGIFMTLVLYALIFLKT